MLPTIVVDHTLRHPHLEADVLAALLKENSSWICAQEIEAQDFSNKDYQIIFESIQAQGSLPINVTVLQETFAFSPLSDIIRRLEERSEVAPLEILSRGLHTLGRMRRLSSTISQSYDLQQQELCVVFPQDELDEEREQSDLSPEDLEAREARRTELCDHANALKLLMIQGLRTRNRDTLQIRGELLYYLAEAYEFASLIDVTVVEAWATQLDVNEIQARAGTMLKIQGQEAHISRAQIQQELLSVDRVWHNLLQAQMSGKLFELLTGLVPLGYYRRDRLPQ